MGEFYIFVSAVTEHWLALMGGAAVVALSLFERVRRNLPTWVWIVLASSFVFYATFQAWQDQFQETENAKSNLAEAVTREAALRSETKEKDKRIAALEVSLHTERVTVNVPSPVVRVASDARAAPHPVLSVTKTHVAKNEAGLIEVTIYLENTGDLEAEAELSASFRLSNLAQAISLPVPTPMIVPRQKAIQWTHPLPFIKDGITQFLNGEILVSVNLTAEYEDQGQQMRYVFEGAVRPNLDHVDIRRNNRERAK